MFKLIGFLKKFLGFGDKYTEGVTVDELEAISYRVPLDKYLFPLAYDEEIGYFILEDNYVGLFFEVPPLSGISESVVFDFERSLYSAPYLPDKTIVQVLMWAYPYLDMGRLSYYLSLKDSRYLPLLENYVNWIRDKTKDPFFIDWPALCRGFKSFILFKIPLPSMEKLLDSSFRNELVNIRINIQSTLNSIFSGAAVSLDGKDYLFYTRLMLNPWYSEEDAFRYADEVKKLTGLDLHDGEFLKDHVIDRESLYYVGPDYIRVRDYYGIVYGVQPGYRGFPSEIPMRFLYEYLGSYMREDYLNLGAPFIFSMVAEKLGDNDKAKIRSEAEVMLKQKGFAALNPRFEERQQDYINAVRDLEKGEVYWKLSFYAYFYSDKGLDHVRSVGRVFQSMMKKQLFDFQAEILPLHFMFCCIPFQVTSEHFSKAFERFTYASSGNMALLTPVVADFKGTKTTTIPLISRRGQFMAFDLFDSDGGYSAAIIAPTGRGKSFLSNHILFNYLTQPNTLVRVIDVGDSYKGLNRLFGGTYIEIKPDEKITLNPFWNIQDLESEIADLTNLMVAMVRFEERVKDVERAFIQKCIKDTYEMMGGRPFSLNDVVETMVNVAQDRGDEDLLAFAQLGYSPYVEGGHLDYLFNGPPNIDLSNRFIVFELKSVLNDPALMRLVLLAFFQLVSREVYFSQDKRHWKKIVLWDEWHRASSSDYILDFSFRAIKEYRKFNASMILVTQNFGDFFNSPIPEKTKNIYSNLEYILSLYQTPEEWMRLKEDNEMLISDFELEVLRTVNTIKGKYSEIFINRRSGGRGIGRLVLPPYYRWVYTTSADEVVVREYFIKKFGGDIDKAVRACIKWEEQGKRKVSRGDGTYDYIVDLGEGF
ncbi:MAG TPA: hypothetical protein ENO30_05880 [Thermodesulfobium narugense]|nr:hypothetical protein [Thermodesulfobium narugense]